MKRILTFFGIGMMALVLFGCSKSVIDVTLDQDEIVLKVGEKIDLKATINPLDASDKSVEWSTSDYKVARVSKDGKVSAIKDGEAIVSVVTNDGKKIASAKIIVNSLSVEEVKLNAAAVEVLIFSRFNLEATVLPSNAFNKKVVWTSSDESIAEVTDKGLVITKNVGQVTITVTTVVGDFQAECLFVVKPINVEKVEIDVSEYDLIDGKLVVAINNNYNLKSIITPLDATNKEVVWSSSNAEAVTIDQNGVLTVLRLLEEGEEAVIITITTVDGEFSDHLDIEIYFQELTSISFIESTTGDGTSLFVGEGHQLTVKFNPVDSSNKDVVYFVSEENQEFLSIDENGYITALKANDETAVVVIVTARNEMFNKEATVEITIHPIINVTSFVVSQSEKEVYAGTQFGMGFTVYPENATNKKINWTSGDEIIATVDENGNVKALTSGEVVITGTTVDGEFTAEMTLTVLSVVQVTDISLDKSNIEMFVGEDDIYLVANIEPEDATNKALIWTSSNFNVLKINAGLLKAISPGVAKVSVTTVDGKFIAECNVVVKSVIKVTSIKIDKSQATLEIGETLALIATVNPFNATNKEVTWRSSNDEVATVDENGIVTAISNGIITITVRTKEGNFSVTCKITVVQPIEEPEE